LKPEGVKLEMAPATLRRPKEEEEEEEKGPELSQVTTVTTLTAVEVRIVCWVQIKMPAEEMWEIFS
jgi:hypothetical protein